MWSDPLSAAQEDLQTYQLSQQEVAFLDGSVYKGKRFARDDIRPHYKPTNKFQYTHFQSCHPPSVFRGLVKGEAIRLPRLSSDLDTYTKLLAKHFRKRGYPYKLVRHSIKYTVPFAHRKTTLLDKPFKSLSELKQPFVCPYQPQISPRQLSLAIKDHTTDLILY